MITSFRHQLAEDLFQDRKTRDTNRLPPWLRRTARRKILYLHASTQLADLRVPPGNRLEQLKGNFKGYHSIRVNDQWRLVFRWLNGNVTDLQLIDYHD